MSQNEGPSTQQGISEPREERWKELARQASQETDADRLLELVRELLKERDRMEGGGPTR